MAWLSRQLLQMQGLNSPFSTYAQAQAGLASPGIWYKTLSPHAASQTRCPAAKF